MRKWMCFAVILILIFSLWGCSDGAEGGSSSKVSDTTPPDIIVQSNVIINANEEFNFKDYLTVTDDQDKPEDIEVELDGETIDTSMPGEYTLTVRAWDRAGNVKTARMFVTVRDSDDAATEEERFAARAIAAVQKKLANPNSMEIHNFEYSNAEGFEIVYVDITALDSAGASVRSIYAVTRSPEAIEGQEPDPELLLVAFDIKGTALEDYVTSETIAMSASSDGTDHSVVSQLASEYISNGDTDIFGVID